MFTGDLGCSSRTDNVQIQIYAVHDGPGGDSHIKRTGGVSSGALVGVKKRRGNS